jgi:hypothetical protein
MKHLQEHTVLPHTTLYPESHDPYLKKLETFCHDFKNHFHIHGFLPSHGVYEEAYLQKNISMLVKGVERQSGLDAIISYLIDDDYFIVKFQDGYSRSAGWSDIEFLSDVECDDFRDGYADIKEEIEIYTRAVENNETEELEEVDQEVGFMKDERITESKSD